MILLNDFQRQWADAGADVMRAVEQVGLSAWYILGERVKKFEASLGAYWQIPHAVGVASGLDAIEIGLRALGCGAGDFVLTSPISAFATPLAILKLGAMPVFADCDEFGLIDLEQCRKVLKERPEIRYFVPVHLFGHSLDLNEVEALRRDFDLKVVEDCAQSIGATHGGRMAGSIGQYAATSFYPTKNLGALGDGGAILTSSEELRTQARCLRDYGQTSKYKHDVLGYNSRLDELQAAILDGAFLSRLPGWIQRRRQIARAYIDGISSKGLIVTGQPAGGESCWHLFPVLVEASRKAEMMAHFRQRGVATGEHYPLALIEQEALAPYRGQMGSDCLKAIDFCHREVSLPIHPYLTDAEVAQVIQAANEWR